MGKLIQMIRTSPDNSLFVYGVTKQNELIFRTSRNIKHLQRENILIDKETCYTNLYHFHINYLNGLDILEITQ